MADKTSKKKPKKAAADPSVLGSLRSTRPTRLGGERRGTATAARATSSSSSAAKPRTKPAAKRTKPAAKRPKPRTRSAPSAAAAKSAAAHRPDTPRTAPPPPQEGRPRAVTTAVQAAGELAQIGLTVGSRILKRAARRLPRP